jgi:serine/threonine protein kinase/tetratricopeptide (TPR) repeat protein
MTNRTTHPSLNPSPRSKISSSARSILLEETTQFLSGTTVGRFRVEVLLGKGAMGEVYRAEDTTLRRLVALKRLAPDVRADARYRRHFLEEATQASRFSDAHIAALYDVLEEHGELFLVMEYVDGETLRQRLRRPMSLDQFFTIAAECAQALAAAHVRGIIHCDIKPENIMLTATGQVKVLDFGVAKHLPHSDQSSTLERASAMSGTPAYMAPEVLLERAIDGRADIFSLGVVLYEMLAGHHPFLSTSFVATSQRILHEEPTSVRLFNPAIPESLETTVAKAIAKDPSQRYPDARALLDDLHTIQQGLTPTKLGGELPRREQKKRRRWLIPVVAVITALVLAAAFGIHRLFSTPILTERGWVLISDFDTGGEDPIPDTGVREALTISLQQSQYVNVYPRNRVYEVLQRMKREPVARIDESLGREICQRENLQVLLTGSIEHVGQVFQITVRALDPAQGNLLFAETERFDRKDKFFEKADDLTRRVRNQLGESVGSIAKTSRPLAKVTSPSLEALQLYSQATEAMARGDTGRVPVLLQGALQLDPNFAMAHLLLGRYYSWIVGKNKSASEQFQKAYDLRQGVTDREQRRIEAEYFTDQERYDEAAQALSLLVSLYPDDAEAHEELAVAYFNVNELDKGIAELRQVLRLNPFSAMAWRNLVLYLARKNADDEAITAFRDAHEHGITSPELHWGLGLAYLGKGNVALAREEFQRIGEVTDTDRDLRDLYLAVSDLYEGKLEAARAKLSSRVNGLPTVRWYLLGCIYLTQNKPQLTASQADLILRTPEAGLQISDLLQAGVLYARAGKIRQARQALVRLEKTWKAGPSSWKGSSLKNLEGEIFLAEHRPEQAEKAFLAADPRARSHIGLGHAYEGLQRWDVAIQEWQQFLGMQGEILHHEFPPDLFVAHLQLARAYRAINDSNHALVHYQQLLRLLQNADDIPLFSQAKREAQQFAFEASPAKNLSGTNSTTGLHYPGLSTRRTSWICCSSSGTRLRTTSSGNNFLRTHMEQSNAMDFG